jgi:GntR family transcriptional regulator
VLDPLSPLPLYRQLAEELIARVRAGDYAVGGRIPSENELAARYNLGRPTVRQATDLLVRRGIVDRRKGAGTFVAAPRPEVDLFTLAGTLAAFEERGLAPTTRLVVKPRLRNIAPDRSNPFSGRQVYSFARLSLLGGVPVLLEHLFLAPDVFPRLDALPVGREPLSRLVEAEYGLRPRGGRQVLTVAKPPARWARVLDVPRSTSLLLVLRRLDFKEAPSALFAKMYCRTDHVEFSQTLNPDGEFVSS